MVNEAADEMAEPRSSTLAFRLSPSERRQLDTIARAAGLSASEFARRAVFGALEVDASALEQAVVRGRNEAHQRLRMLQQELSDARRVATAWQSRALDLETRLSAAPQELIAGVRGVLAGVPEARSTVATIWSRIDYEDRCALLAIVAAVTIEEVERGLIDLPIAEEAVDVALAFMQRAHWLMETLTPESGRAHARIPLPLRREWSSLQALLAACTEELRLRIEALEKRESRRATDLVRNETNAGSTIHERRAIARNAISGRHQLPQQRTPTP